MNTQATRNREKRFLGVLLFTFFAAVSCGQKDDGGDSEGQTPINTQPQPTPPLNDPIPTPTPEPIPPPAPDDEAPLPTIGSKLVWSDVQPIVQAKCVACHGPNSRKPLDRPSLIWVDRNRDQVLSAIATTVRDSKMPPARATQLTQTEKTLLIQWVADGGVSEATSVERL